MVLADRIGNKEEAQKLGLLESEYELICDGLGRAPTFTELAMFSGMWSEHCSYKNSILLLKQLYSQSDRLLAKPGEENAGALRLDDRLAVVFKIESHNHPSAIEPYQGAATGVGGIMRDIFTMGARPIISLNSLRFGNPTEPRNKWLLKNVVKGIGDYGNALGIACAAGEIFFHDSYSKNPLVNAMTVGIAEIDKMASARAGKPGNLVIYVGAKTGRDGIHGASFASKELSNESAEERSAVQVGDPFMEKLLMEATLECLKKKLVVAIQDMGAAGLVSSSSEMSASGGVGMRLALEKVPAREEGMEPFEFMLSESQERMLLIVEKDRKEEVLAVFEKWELDAAVIGETTAGKNLTISFHGKIYADLPAELLAKKAPRYEREFQKPAHDLWARFNHESHQTPDDFSQLLTKNDTEGLGIFLQQLLSEPNFASKEPVYEQYDTDIGLGKIIGPGQNAGVYRVPNSQMALSVTVDGNGFYVAQEPYLGAQHTVAECYRNIVSSGATPIGLTNCLNFANPYKPENFYFFRNAVLGMSDACAKLKIPITGGNVSFYNESEDGPVLPTPTMGMVGLLEDASYTLPAILQPGERLAVLGFFKPQLGGSLYAYLRRRSFGGVLPPLDLEQEIRCGELLLSLNRKKLLSGAIDLSFGGLLYAALRLVFAANRKNRQTSGLDLCGVLSLPVKQSAVNFDELYFGESAHSYLVAYLPEKEKEIVDIATRAGVPFQPIGMGLPADLLKLGDAEIVMSQLQSSFENGLKLLFY